MVVVVADAGLEAGGRTSRLDAPDDAFAHQDAERVVDRLQGNRANFRPDGFGHAIRGDMRVTRDRPQHGQPLGRDLKAVLTKDLRGVSHHRRQ